MIIAVCGNILSGKSTLAKLISSIYGYSFIPNKRSELNFLDDFFDNIPERFFATQTSFLLSKAIEIKEESKKHNNIVIDRSMYEDVNVFAKLWMDNYQIDTREKQLYSKLSSYIINSVPKTDIYLYCKCKQSTIERRFSQRPHRSFEDKYPSNYIEQLVDLYQKLSFPNDSIVIEIDTEAVDLREQNSVIELIDFINRLILSENNTQLSFLENSQRSLCPPSFCNIVSYGGDSLRIIEKKKMTIYLAAPFSEFAIEKEDTKLQIGDVDDNREYDVLPLQYRRFLSKCANIIEEDGRYNVLLPHRDENNWGKSYKSSEQVMIAMINNIKYSNLIVAILSNSIGVHMEIAMMIALKKPIIIVIVEDLTTGFYAEGLINNKKTVVKKVKNLKEAKKYISSDEFHKTVEELLEYE